MICADGTLSALPPHIVSFAFQRSLVSGTMWDPIEGGR
jgi:hypothetical protein